MKEEKDSVATPPPFPHSSLVLLVSLELILPSSPHVQVVDLGDCGSSESESTKSDEIKKKAK